MKDWQIEVTDEYERLVQFFVANELEFDGDEEVDTDIVKCWKVEEEKAAGAEKKDAAGRLIAGCVLALIVSGPGCFCGFLGHDREYVIPYKDICQVGEDIILVDVKRKDVEEKCKV